MHFSPGIKTRRGILGYPLWLLFPVLSARGVHRHVCFFERDVTSDMCAAADMARVKQTTRHRCRYVMSSSSSPLSSVIESTSSPSSEKTISDSPSFIKLLSGHTIEFRMSHISSRHMQKVQQLGYFGSNVGRFGSRGGLEARGELVVFKVFLALVFDYPSTSLWSMSWSIFRSSSISSHLMIWRYWRSLSERKLPMGANRRWRPSLRTNTSIGRRR